MRLTEEGTIEPFAKVNGRKKSLNALFDAIKQRGQNIADFPIGILHADCEEDAQYLKNKIEEEFGRELEIWVQPIGPVIGTHCGPGTVGLAFHGIK